MKDLSAAQCVPPNFVFFMFQSVSFRLFSRHGLYNWRPYTAMHCSCDDRFRSCLKLSRSRSADTVGKVFFNVIKTAW